MRHCLTAALPVLAGLLAAACAGPGWHKPGADAETLKQDLGACQALAFDRVSRPNPAAPPVALDPRFGVQAEGALRPAEARMREQQLVDGCMREKGYVLGPPT